MGARPMSWSRHTRVAAAACVAVAALIGSAGGAAASPAQDSGHGPVVRTAGGWVQGTTAGATAEYLGIPYAAPPVGPLRWQPPQAAASWRGIRAATSFAPHCPQPASPFGVASTSEDCL